jgi:hypothetical protein
MAATKRPGNAGSVKPSHDYHAEAHALSGHLIHPIKQTIKQQAPSIMRGRKDGHAAHCVENFSLKNLISFDLGHSRVSGNRNPKTNGWVTLSTSAVRELNIFEVITADRVVAQASTDHAHPSEKDNGHVPHVTFLGTQFDDLRVSGFPVAVKLNLNFIGKKPENNKSYLQEREFLQRARNQVKIVVDAPDLPKYIKDKYSERLAIIDNLLKGLDEGGKGDDKPVVVTCSLVESIGPIQIPGAKTAGNVMFIPNFGCVELAVVEVRSSPALGNSFCLNMLDMTMGCIANGCVIVAGTGLNGRTHP